MTDLSPEALARLADAVAERVTVRLGQERDRLWTDAEAARYLGVAVRTLRAMRASGEIPHVVLPGGRKKPRVRYEPGQLRAWARAGGRRVTGRQGRRLPRNTA